MKAYFVKEIVVIDPDTKGDVSVAIYKEEAGGMFGIDASFLENVLDENDTVTSVFGNGQLELID